jgi:hypothetical protein
MLNVGSPALVCSMDREMAEESQGIGRGPAYVRPSRTTATRWKPRSASTTAF